MWLKGLIGRRRIRHGEMVRWKAVVRELRNPSIELPYLGRAAFRPQPLGFWWRTHYKWHGKTYRWKGKEQ